jgi:3D (Asp-Asp-Asp) domain-containing protein
MALRISGKLVVIGVVLALLITAFSMPSEKPLVNVLVQPRLLVVPVISLQPVLRMPAGRAYAYAQVANLGVLKITTPAVLAFNAFPRVSLVMVPQVEVLETISVVVEAEVQVLETISVVVEAEVQVLELAAEAALTEAVIEPAVAEAAGSLVVKATAYNSLASQTDDTPHITATGATTSFGIVALSRDLLEQIPYGSLVRLRDLGDYKNGNGVGHYQTMLDGQAYFIVEDTMHQRKYNQLDIWFPSFNDAIHWGVRRVELEVVRYGRQGTVLLAEGTESVSGSSQ